MSNQNSREGFVKRAFRRYFIDAMSAMALGLFSSLIIGLILSQLSQIPLFQNVTVIRRLFEAIAPVVAASSPVVGAAIGVAIAYGLHVKPLVIFSSAVTGAIGYSLGGPVGAYIAAVVGAEIGNLVAGKTPVDIVLVPIVTILTGGLIGAFVGPPINSVMTGLGNFINTATYMHPIPMGIVISVVMGLALTAPISSAAISISLGLSGIAAGAACVGCATQMVGFAVASYRENKVGGLISQGIGTSMLQFGNIMRRPVIWLPPTIASAILGPISTAVLGMTNNAMGAGMGTSGLVGQFGAWEAMQSTFSPGWIVAMILLMHFLLPALLTWGISEFFRKRGWIKFGDMQLTLKS
ncbi:PTS sugar transporter subunit IIC [Christensenellaceae bacterium OttesenSCG-928-L17]|nr:PTS sugar transporter subunit IIC [Christensenellaceae bacterium OttesenSCG-928-L17]